MPIEFNDHNILKVNADLLDVCCRGQFIESLEKSTDYKGIHWSLRCYPNGAKDDQIGKISVGLYTSTVDGFSADWTFTVDRSDIEIKGYFNLNSDYEMSQANTNLADHETIRSGLIIQDSSFTIRCSVKFKNDQKLSSNSVVRPISEDCCIIKFNRKTLTTFKPEQEIIEEMRTLDGITWWIQYYPCGGRQEFKEYVSVCFHVHGGTINAKCSCAVSIGGVLIQMAGVATSKKGYGWRKGKCFSHQQCQLADHNNDVIALVCKITFETPAQMPNAVLPFSLYEDTDTMVVKVDYLDFFEPCQYFQSTKRPIGYNNLMWWLKCYPNGSTIANKGYLSLFLYTNGRFKAEADITFIINGLGVRDQLHSFCKDTVQNECHKLASHELVRSSSIIENGAFIIRCKVSFKKFEHTDPTQSSKNGVKSSNKVFDPIRRDSCIVKLNRKDLETYKPEKSIVIKKQTVDDTLFIIEYFPCGSQTVYNGYVSVCFSVTGGPKVINFSCAMSVNGVLVQLSGVGVHDGMKCCWAKGQCFSHKQCRSADHNNDVIDLVCKFHFKSPLVQINAPRPTLAVMPDQNPPHNSSAETINKTERSSDIEMAVNIFRKKNPLEIEQAKSLALHLTCLRDYYKHFKRSVYSTSLPDPVGDKKYYFIHGDATLSTATVKDKMENPLGNKMFVKISADELFTNFNKASPGRPVGAFTHCLYELTKPRLLNHNKEGVNANSLNYTFDYIVVTGIDSYVSDDGFETVYNLIHSMNLSQYYDEAMSKCRIDAAAINFVFTCTKLPELLIWRLAVDFKENLKFEPELETTKRISLENGLKTMEKTPWEIKSVNCRDEVVKKVQSILNSKTHGILSLDLARKLQTELRRWYPNWRVCAMEMTPLWRFAVPCLIYRKAACDKTWYLVFYAPLEWSEPLFDGAVSECGEDDTEVQQRFGNYDNLTNHNNLNTVEQGLNNILGYPVSLFPHQNAAGAEHYGIFINHRKVYHTVNIRSNYDYLCRRLIRVAVLFDEPFKSAIFAVQQVIDRKVLSDRDILEHALPTVFTAVKQLLTGISSDQCIVIYCNRNTALKVGNRQSAIVTVGSIKVVVVVL